VTIQRGDFAVLSPDFPGLGGGAISLALDGSFSLRCLAVEGPCVLATHVFVGAATIKGLTSSAVFGTQLDPRGAASTLGVLVEFGRPSESKLHHINSRSSPQKTRVLN
jgi:hypothetical protein